MEKEYKINWSDAAKSDLRNIYDFISQKSVQGARNVITDIRNAPRTIHFQMQYQREEFMPECRRVIVRQYKVLYTVDENRRLINIVRVFDARQDPKKM